MSAAIEQIAPDDQKATYLGAAQFHNIGGFIGPIFGGWLLVQFTDGMYIVIAMLSFAVFTFMEELYKKIS